MEIAIVLVVVALLSAGAISLLRIQREQAAIRDTRANIDEAKEAILAYAEVNKGLPCPDTNDDGLAEDACSNSVRRGIVPWKSLGLSNNDDAWSHSLHYLISPNLIKGTLTKLDSKGDINVSDGSGTSVVTQDAVAFAVWSVGPDGEDASSTEGAASNKVNVASTTAPVDDIVSWASRYVMIGRILQAGQVLTLN